LPATSPKPPPCRRSLYHGKKREQRRNGKKQPTAYLDEVVHEQLRKVGFEERRKMHSYLMEGLDRVFADRGLPSIKSLVPSYPYTLVPGSGYLAINVAEN
jgi:hypothetical protein